MAYYGKYEDDETPKKSEKEVETDSPFLDRFSGKEKGDKDEIETDDNPVPWFGKYVEKKK